MSVPFISGDLMRVRGKEGYSLLEDALLDGPELRSLCQL